MSTFPNDAVSKYISINGNTTKATILSGATPRTILWFSTTHGWTGSTDILYCGNTIIFQWTEKNSPEIYGYFPPQWSAIPCSSVVYYTNAGYEIDQFNIVYTNYDLATYVPEIPDPTLPAYMTQLVDGNGKNFYVNTAWSGGELFISFALTCIISIMIFKFIFGFFNPRVVKIKRKNYD